MPSYGLVPHLVGSHLGPARAFVAVERSDRGLEIEQGELVDGRKPAAERGGECFAHLFVLALWPAMAFAQTPAGTKLDITAPVRSGSQCAPMSNPQAARSARRRGNQMRAWTTIGTHANSRGSSRRHAERRNTGHAARIPPA